MGEPAKSIVTIGYAAANESKIQQNSIGHYRAYRRFFIFFEAEP